MIDLCGQNCVEPVFVCRSAVSSWRVTCIHCGAQAWEGRLWAGICRQESSGNDCQGWAQRQLCEHPPSYPPHGCNIHVTHNTC